MEQDHGQCQTPLGLVTVTGNATRSSVLRTAGVQHAPAVIVATNQDDTAVLVTLTARELSEAGCSGWQ